MPQSSLLLLVWVFTFCTPAGPGMNGIAMFSIDYPTEVACAADRAAAIAAGYRATPCVQI
jgi:hypothetical protein